MFASFGSEDWRQSDARLHVKLTVCPLSRLALLVLTSRTPSLSWPSSSLSSSTVRVFYLPPVKNPRLLIVRHVCCFVISVWGIILYVRNWRETRSLGGGSYHPEDNGVAGEGVRRASVHPGGGLNRTFTIRVLIFGTALVAALGSVSPLRSASLSMHPPPLSRLVPILLTSARPLPTPQSRLCHHSRPSITRPSALPVLNRFDRLRPFRHPTRHVRRHLFTVVFPLAKSHLHVVGRALPGGRQGDPLLEAAQYTTRVEEGRRPLSAYGRRRWTGSDSVAETVVFHFIHLVSSALVRRHVPHESSSAAAGRARAVG